MKGVFTRSAACLHCTYLSSWFAHSRSTLCLIARFNESAMFAIKKRESETDIAVKIRSEEPSAQLTAALPFTAQVILVYHSR